MFLNEISYLTAWTGDRQVSVTWGEKTRGAGMYTWDESSQIGLRILVPKSRNSKGRERGLRSAQLLSVCALIMSKKVAFIGRP
jgi:hypothetical protein